MVGERASVWEHAYIHHLQTLRYTDKQIMCKISADQCDFRIFIHIRRSYKPKVLLSLSTNHAISINALRCMGESIDTWLNDRLTPIWSRETSDMLRQNMAAVIIAQANAVAWRRVSAVRITPAGALLKYRHDVGKFKNNPTVFIRSSGIQASMRWNARWCPTPQYIA